MSKEI